MKWLSLKNGSLGDDDIDTDKEFTTDIEHNEKVLKETFQDCSDLIYRRIEVRHKLQWLIIYIESMIDPKLLDEHVIKPMLASPTRGKPTIEAGDLATDLISIGSTSSSNKVSETVRKLLDGHAVVLTAESSCVMAFSIPGLSKRSLEESSSEPVIRGPKDGFIEQLSTNLSLIRTRLKTSKLKVEYITLGELSQTHIAITYMKGIVREAVVEEVRSRLKQIQLKGVLDSGYIEEFIEDQPYSPFPQVHSTERPDVVSAELLEGKVAILVDNTPFVLIVPTTFWTGLQASEDYYIRWPSATFARWIRFLFINFAIFAPPLYVAISTFHQEMIPTNLVLSIAASREAVPFPAMFEALLMEIIFEALREAGIRLPKQIGPTISIVGGLVIGQAAVQAGFISAPVVIIVSITGISAFTIPRYSLANGVRLLRFPMLFLAGTLGLYGIVLGFLGILLHMTSLRSFGVLYFSPIAPLKLNALKDVFVRVPIWAKSRFRTKPDHDGGGQGRLG
ncbi:Spore germination protein A1 [Paenibacillus solanacearum]|uniref:Spore germination protein A1 n=1 Tax=Paenibacillus solanacearum TaxID=2048548 RepID=A0A916NVK7_9BACL|nr:spore germination protein [Paenibacillus solanacearum]CAG7608529.1 Spore germination protein A1 [Paenibacillus solanacearum]